MIIQQLSIAIAQYRAVAVIADDTHWQSISAEATRIRALKAEN
jgi:hypothetical protein